MPDKALLVTARKHLRLIDKVDGVTDVSDVELVRDIGWAVTITIIANQDGWQAMGLLKSAGADIVVEGCEPVDYSEFQLKVGMLWECSESFNDALLEVLAVDQWLTKMAGRR